VRAKSFKVELVSSIFEEPTVWLRFVLPADSVLVGILLGVRTTLEEYGSSIV